MKWIRILPWVLASCAVQPPHSRGGTTGDVAVQTPGGRLRVTVTPDTTVLHGPAVLVASGELDADWWAGL